MSTKKNLHPLLTAAGRVNEPKGVWAKRAKMGRQGWATHPYSKSKGCSLYLMALGMAAMVAARSVTRLELRWWCARIVAARFSSPVAAPIDCVFILFGSGGRLSRVSAFEKWGSREWPPSICRFGWPPRSKLCALRGNVSQAPCSLLDH